MKKLGILFVLCVLVMTASPAFAGIINDWEIDLSSFGLGDYTNISNLTMSGSGNINQSFGSDGIFNVGDTFKEYSMLQTIGYYAEPGQEAGGSYYDLSSLNGYYVYAYGTGLTGTVDTMTGTPFQGSNAWYFTYVFDEGVGNVGLYLDTDMDFSNGLGAGGATLATFSIANPSGGDLGSFKGGISSNGTSNLTMLFDTMYDDVFKTSNGTSLEDLGVDAYGLLNTNNITFDASFYPGQTPTQYGGATIQVTSDGPFNVAVPEPASMALFGTGLLGMALRRKKRS